MARTRDTCRIGASLPTTRAGIHPAPGAAMLTQVADGVPIHQSEFCQSNAVVVQGRAGVLLIDPGVHGHEMAALANDLRELCPARCGRVFYASALGSPAMARPARRGASLRHGSLRSHGRSSAVGPALEGQHRRVDSAGHRRADHVGPVWPHYRPARRSGAGSLGRTPSPDYRASGAPEDPGSAGDGQRELTWGDGFG